MLLLFFILDLSSLIDVGVGKSFVGGMISVLLYPTPNWFLSSLWQDNVKIISKGEVVTGDYGTLDTKNNSYKIKSNDKTKVKVIIQNDE